MNVGACASNDGVASEPAPAKATAPVACDPLAPKPITLGAIVGVGTDESGTSYVDATNGVFVSVADGLDRQHVTGSGQSGTTEYLFSFEPPEDPARAPDVVDRNGRLRGRTSDGDRLARLASIPRSSGLRGHATHAGRLRIDLRAHRREHPEPDLLRGRRRKRRCRPCDRADEPRRDQREWRPLDSSTARPTTSKSAKSPPSSSR